MCLVSGDDHTCQEASAALGPHVEAVAVKRGLDRFVAECRSPAAGTGVIADEHRGVEVRVDSGHHAQRLVEAADHVRSGVDAVV